MLHEKKGLLNRISELEELLELSERKSDILTNLLKEASAEFQQALEKVTVSESNFRAIFENAPEAIYILDMDNHRILDCNPFTEKWLGYSREKLLSMGVEDILEPGTPDIRKNLQIAVDRGLVRILERRFRKKDGTIVDAEVTGTLVEYQGKSCLVALVRDITERKKLEELSRYKALFANVSDPVFINDARGRFLEVNDVACDYFGYPRPQLLKMAIKDLRSPGQDHLIREMGERLISGETVKFELELMTCEGRHIPFEFHARSIRYRGNQAVLSVARDLSVRKQMEDTLVKTERLSALGEMASGVAHNYNNLLQIIIASGEVALSKLNDGRIREAKEAINCILDAGHRGADIVRRIKDFTHISSGRLGDNTAFDMGDLLMEAVKLTKPLWKDPQHPNKYRLHFEKPQKVLVKANASEIYEVLINLIKNALEAMPGGGDLEITTEKHDSRIHVSISDRGEGIPEESLERIFEPFFTTKGKKSSGLGLSSSYGIIKKNLGEMKVESRPGKGSRFTINLPLAEEHPVRQKQVSTPVETGKIRFLLIDDEINILKAMEMYFEDTAIELDTAVTASQGLKTLREKEYDIILCDLGMDDMNGWMVGKKVKELCMKMEKPKIPFLLYTGLDKPLNPEKLIESGVDRVITKPVSCGDIHRIIRETVKEA